MSQKIDRVQIQYYGIICLLGYLINFSAFALFIQFTNIVNYINTRNYSNLQTYTKWALEVIAEKKPLHLFMYCSSVGVFLGFFILAYLILFNRKSDNIISESKIFYFFGFISLLTVVYDVYFQEFWFFILNFIWINIFIFLYYKKSIKKAIPLFFTIIPLSLFLFAMHPFLKINSLMISNDFLWVPETTIIKQHIIDNNIFITENKLGGLFASKSGEKEIQKYAQQRDLIPGFLKENLYEIKNQLVAGHYFHHHYAMLGPINELNLGKPIPQIVFLYGLGNTLLINQLMKYFGNGYTFENYHTVLYSFYPIYFFLLFMCSIFLFRDSRYVMLMTMGVIATFFLIGFEAFRYAPGFNPIRHLLDIPLLLFFYGFLYARKNRYVFLHLTFLSAILAIIANKEFGLMMTVSLIIASLISVILNAQRSGYIVTIIFYTMLAILITWHLDASFARNSLSIYSLLGVSISPTNKIKFLLLLTLIASGYIFLLSLIHYRGVYYKRIYLILFLFFYSQCLWLYYVWYSDRGHLLVTAPIWILCATLFMNEFLFFFKNKKYVEKHSVILATGVVVGLLGLGAFKYFKQLNEYYKIFATHKIYQWNFDTAHFKTTMDPEVFTEAVSLINQYSKKDNIYIISKYDNILPFLAKKYSALPFLELPTSLASKKEIYATIAAILKEKPQYIFLDSDILNNHMGDIVDPRTPAGHIISDHGLSRGRVQVLNELKTVYNGIASEYKIIKHGYLISVYEHV